MTEKCKCKHGDNFHINPEKHNIKQRKCTAHGCNCPEFEEAK